MTRYVALFTAALIAGCSGFGAQSPSIPTQSLQTNVHPAVSCPAAQGGTGILSDGDFSQATQPQSTIGFSKGQAFAPSWRVAKGSIDFVSPTYWNMAGLCSIDVDGGSPGAFTHKGFPTAVNAKYTVTFLLSGNSDGAPTVKTLKVSAANQSITYTWDTSNGNDPRHGKYAKKTWTFTAAKASTVLKFASLDPTSAYGPVVAKIAVKKV